jgi:1-acyl-sn-glycerol-3-phosphate acyltransferase
MQETIFRMFRWVLWNVLSRIFVIVYLRPLLRYSKASGSDKLPSPPFILVSNHGTFFDPWIVGWFSPTPVSFMCNDDAFRASATTQWYLTKIGAFPKKKGATDIKAMKETLRRLGRRDPVCIFPEGQTTWDGRTQLIYRGIEKLVRKADCPLVLVRLCGNFLSRPWWARRWRRGRVLVEIRVVRPEAIAGMSDEMLFETMRSYIRHDDIRDERNQSAGFSGSDFADGLERFVWICPNCHSEDRLITGGNIVSCESCGGRWEMDALCGFKPLRDGLPAIGDLADWADDHRKIVLERIQACKGNAVLTRSENVERQAIAADGYSFNASGRGTLSLTKHELRFELTDKKDAGWVAKIPEIKDCVIQKKDLFECRVGDKYFRFAFNRHSPMKWIYYLRYLQGYEECETRGYL